MNRYLSFCLFLLLCFSVCPGNAQQIQRLSSPDGKLSLEIQAGPNLVWSLKYGETTVIAPSAIAMMLSTGQSFGKDVKLQSAKKEKADRVFSTPLYKKSEVRDNYNQLTLNFKGNYGVIFRLYNDGAAYRFFSRQQQALTITNEQAEFHFPADLQVYLPFVNDYRNNDRFNTSFENHYTVGLLSSVKKDTLAFLPVLAGLADGLKVAILECDLKDYPGMYLQHTDSETLEGVFAPYPAVEFVKGLNYVVKSREAYIAKTQGPRNFPWRVLVVTDDDRKLADNDMMRCLATPNVLPDVSWIKPGKVAWDWWNDWNISHVNFKSGINVPTYKYYIDFAAANKLEYIIVDEGWSEDYDLNKTKLDIKEIVDYGKKKNVGVILWSTWYAITRDEDGLFKKFSDMGIKGFKIDFIDRDDQKIVSSLYEIAAVAARYHMLVDFHGMYKPSGMNVTFPNVINFEGVKGLENMKWGVDDQPGYDVTVPFIRMLAGPMDYTPGAMRNATRDAFRPINSNPMSQGTRCHQLAMYTIFEAPLQMLADNPTTYSKEQECTDFIDSIPTVFDQTVAVNGNVGQYICLARRKGSVWYAGAMTNWDKREMTIDLSFLGPGKYQATLFRDGVNADRDATDYYKEVITVTSADTVNLSMAPGGGWAAIFRPLSQ
jgi:alpha-glucosidase